MADLIPPHGGLSEPVCRTVPASEAQAFQSEAAKLPKVPVSQADLSTVYRIADGTLSPLTGPMNRAVYNRVLDEAVIEHNGKLYAWTIPLAFPVTKELAATLAAGKKVALTATRRARSSPRSTSPTSSSGTSRATSRASTAPSAPIIPAPTWSSKGMPRKRTSSAAKSAPCLSPRTRASASTSSRHAKRAALVAKKGWNARRRLPDAKSPAPRPRIRPRLRLEELTREGKTRAPSSIRSSARQRGRRQRRHPHANVQALDRRPGTRRRRQRRRRCGSRAAKACPIASMLLGVDIKMFYGGPKEAVMHSIYRQNMGFTDIVIGRKHADAPYADGTPIWGDFDAQEIFSKLKGDLKIKPIKVGFAAFYESLGRVDLTERHANEKPVSISGKEVRATLMKGELVDPRIMRPSTSRILSAAMTK